jgi:EpsI family protein
LSLPLAGIGERLAGWRLTAEHSLDLRTKSRLKASEYVSRTYEKAGQPLDLLIVFYADQRAGEGIHSPKACLPGAGWILRRHSPLTLPVRGQRIEINYYSAQRASKRRALLYWYQQKDAILTSEYAAKLSLLRNALWTGDTGGALIRIVIPDEPAARDGAAEFASAVVTTLQRSYK